MIDRVLQWVKSRDRRWIWLMLLAAGLSLLGWLLFFTRHHLPHSWDKPLLALAGFLIGMKLWALILTLLAALAVRAYRWFKPSRNTEGRRQAPPT
jgi:tellurite resistance protein TehA-like permease